MGAIVDMVPENIKVYPGPDMYWQRMYNELIDQYILTVNENKELKERIIKLENDLFYAELHAAIPVDPWDS